MMRKFPNEKAEATKYNEEQLQLLTLRRWEGDFTMVIAEVDEEKGRFDSACSPINMMF